MPHAGPMACLKRPDHALLRRSPDQQFGHHDGQAHGGDAHEVHEDEGPAVVLPRDERELPQVAEADRAPGRGEN